MKETGKYLLDAFEGVRNLIVLASRSKPPQEDLAQSLLPYFSATQDAVKKIRELRLDRDYDRHQKATIEMLACVAWVFQKPPAQLPATFVKEILGSAEFWSNRVRKDYKGKDDKQIAFCDNIRKVINELVAYIQDNHATGLSFNPRGVSLAEAAIVLSDEPSPAPERPGLAGTPGAKSRRNLGTTGGNMAGLMGELSKRKDGDSAATGLKKVTKDQQTWRKEFKKEDATPTAPSLEELKAKKEQPKKKKGGLKGLPIFEYQDRGFKWVVENHTKDSVAKEISNDGMITVEISDPKQQVYIYNCEDVTVKVIGKFKNLILDTCTKVNVVFDTIISGVESVNSKKIQLQVTGVCPVFTIDKTVNVTVYLSEESKSVSTFTTSLSSEMNVSFPDGDDIKEMPIPEQFVHKLTNNSVTSEVSDLYH